MQTLDLNRRFISSVSSLDFIGPEKVAEIMYSARSPDLRDVVVANQLICNSGYYLDAFHMEALLSASVCDDEIRRTVALRKELYLRLCDLLPPIVRFFEFEPDRDHSGFFLHLEDTLWDYQFIVKADRRDKLTRLASNRLRDMSKLVSDLTAALSTTGRHIDVEYERFFSSYMNLNKQKINEARSLNDLERDLGYLKMHIELALLQIGIDDDFLIVTERSEKSHLVEAAHWMSEAWSGPRLVTTPGSDFSLLCSLLLEATGGPRGESLAGAINRYARSKKRFDLDSYNTRERKRKEDLAKGIEDNFLGLEDMIEMPTESLAKYLEAIKHPLASENDRLLLQVMIQQTSADIEATMNRYGPNLVWADRESEASRRSRREELEVKMEYSRELKLELGRLRRRLSAQPKK